jgi:pyruvate ferredoxin oxidoreductase alpha subunit
VLVNLDGFYLSFTREPVRIPAQTEADRFLSPFNPGSIRMRGGEPLSEGVAVLDGSTYSYFRYEAHLASLQGLAVYEELGREFGDLFGRSYSGLECYLSEDAEIVFVMIGSFATKAKEAVDRLREAGKKAGLVRPRLLRPFPAAPLRQALAGRKGVAVIDQNLSPGKGGILQAELASVLYGMAGAPPILASFVGGLGGRDISSEEFFEIYQMVQQAVAAKATPEPRLLYTEEELRAIRKMQNVAGVHGNRQGGGT